MKYDYDDVWAILNKCPQKYGNIGESGTGFIYEFDEEEIREAKWKLLSPAQKDELFDWCKAHGEDAEEEWYKANAKEIWEKVEKEAGEEEDDAQYLIEEAERIAELVENYDDFVRQEYYRDRI